MRNFALHCIVLVDGCCMTEGWGAPGAGCGWSIIDGISKEEVRYGRKRLYNLDAMEAEYSAVLQGVLEARIAGYKHITIRCDSDSVVKDINGEVDLGPKFFMKRRALKRAQRNCTVVVECVSRNTLKRPHKLAGEAARDNGEDDPQRALDAVSLSRGIGAVNGLRHDTQRLKSAVEHRMRYGEQGELAEALAIFRQFQELFGKHIQVLEESILAGITSWEGDAYEVRDALE